MGGGPVVEPFPMIYVAGPYRSNPLANTARACRFGASLLDAGVAAVVPHTTGSWDVVTPRPDQVWLDLGLAYVDRCEAIARLSGESEGSDTEVALAMRSGLRVFEQGDETDDAFAARVVEWALAVRGRPKFTLVVEEFGLQVIYRGFDKVWQGWGRAGLLDVLRVDDYGSGMVAGVSLEEIYDAKNRRTSHAVLFSGREVGRWSAYDGCYPIYVLEALRDAGAITLRVVGGGA